MTSLLVYFVLSSCLISAWAVSSDGYPVITPNVNQTVIQTGEKIELLCSATEPIHWSYPQLYDESGVLVVDEIPTIVYNYDGFKYTSHLSVRGANYLYTARYYCQRNDNSQPHPSSAANIYVYVKDEDNLIVLDSMMLPFLSVQQHGYVLIPCRPSSPDIQIELFKEGELVDSSSFEKGNMTIEYDPTDGITLRHVDIKNGGDYECVAKLGDITSTSIFSVNVSPYTESVSKPMMDNIQNMHVEVGDTVIINCWVEMASNIKFNMNWIYPNTKEENRIFESNTTHKNVNVGNLKQIQYKYERNLTIHNATHRDEGDYTCRIVDHNGNTNNVSHYMKVYDINTTYNDLVYKGNTTARVYAGNISTWVVSIIAHPKPQITWYGQYQNEIRPSENIDIIISEKETVLKIKNVEIEDTGNYSLKSENNNGTKWKNFSLIVLDKPLVQLIDDNAYFNQGERYTIRCKVAGYPKPKVSWFISYCRIPHECENADTFEINHYKNDTNMHYTELHRKEIFWESELNILAQDSGQVFCCANNEIGGRNHSINFIVTDIGNEDQFSVWGPENPIEGDEVRLHCGGVVSNFSSDISWFRTELYDKKEHIITNDTDFTVLNTSTYLSYQSTILIPNITKRYNGVYVCVLNKLEGYEKMEEINVHVQDLQAPFYIYTNMNETKWYRDSRSTLQWKCLVGGTPQPVVTWYKNDLPLSKETLKGVSDIPRLEWSEGNQTLIIKFLDEADDGTYKCKAENKVGKVEKSVTLDVKGAGLNKGVIGGISIMIIACLVIVIYMGWRIKKERKLRKEMTLAGLINFEEGAMDNMNPELPLDEQAELLPYDNKWEFPRDKLKLGKQLGAGAFGVVMKAEAWGIVEGETVSTVAVKMVKKNADYTYLKALASELKIMVHLGKHLNVVNLLGASTKNLAKKELLVIVEFCRYGNLHNYLIRHRDHFIDQIDMKTGLMDSSIGSEILARAASLSAKAKIRYAALSFNNSEENSFGENAKESSGYLTPRTSSLPPNSPGIEADMSPISMTPAGEDSMILSNNSIQPDWRSNVRGDYKPNNVRPICTRDLLCWAFQVARGMEYLVGRKVLHGDLAARNILLADDNIVKICDFGLAKSMYKSDNYQKKGDGPLPVKWMSVESIRDRIFSTQSDVWSFGIVLWEFFSLARTPYPGMEADEKLYNKLVDGYRMECPEYATKEVYKIMLECWQAHPTQRPSFTDLSDTLGAMLEESVRNHYIDLNSPYMDMNMIQLEGHSDYLNMMSAPTYGNLVSPSYEGHEHHYVNNPEEANRMAQEAAEGSSGYLVMKGTQPPVSDAVIFSPRTGLISGNIFQFGAPSGHKNNRIMETQADSELRPILTNADESPIQRNNLNNSNQGSTMMRDAEPYKEMKITNDLKLGTTTSPCPTACFSNPNYQGPIPIKPSTDNYINMQQQKSEGNPKKYQESSQEGLSSSNQNYLFMGKPGEAKKDQSSNSSQQINTFSNPNYQAKVPQGSETYVNLPN